MSALRDPVTLKEDVVAGIGQGSRWDWGLQVCGRAFCLTKTMEWEVAEKWSAVAGVLLSVESSAQKKNTL